MQIASKCKPARAVRAKTREKSGQYQKYNPSLHLKESYCIYPEWIITHEKCSGPFSTSEYFLVSCLQTYFPLVVNAVLSSWFL